MKQINTFLSFSSQHLFKHPALWDKQKFSNIACYKKKRIHKLVSSEAAATLEVVILSAILIALALIFNEKIREFANLIFEKMFNKSVIDKITLAYSKILL